MHFQHWKSLKIPIWDEALGWEFYKTQTKELNIFPVLHAAFLA